MCIIIFILIVINLILLILLIKLREKEKFIVNPPLNFGGFFSNLPKFYNNCDGDHTLIVELFEGDYTLNDLSLYGFFDSKNGIDCVNIPSGFSVILYDNDNFQGNKIILYPSEKNYLFKNNFNINIRSLRIRTIPVFYTWCNGNGFLFSLKDGKYLYNDLNNMISGKSLQLRSFYVPKGFRVKIYTNDNFNNILLDIMGPNYIPCLKKDEDKKYKNKKDKIEEPNINSIIVDDLLLESL